MSQKVSKQKCGKSTFGCILTIVAFRRKIKYKKQSVRLRQKNKTVQKKRDFKKVSKENHYEI